MQTGLSIEQHDISIDDVPFYDVPHRKVISNCSPISKPQKLLILAARDKVRAGMDVRPVAHGGFEGLDVVHCHAFGVGEDLGDALGDGDLVDAQVGVGRDDGAAGEVDALSGEVAAEAALLAFEALDEAADGFLAWLGGDAGELGVDVHCDGELEEFPLFLWVFL